jgi:carbonic anhydrase
MSPLSFRPLAVAAALAVAFIACSRNPAPDTAAADHHDVHWSYSGAGGPEHWGTLQPDFAACAAGKNQSPIDITHAAPSDLPNIVFNYAPSAVNILNNGHTIQVNYDAGSYIEIDGVRYDLVQFHFHAPSEHTINGKRYPAELHLVHKSANGELAVVGVMMEKGAENLALKPVWDHLPAKEGPEEHYSAAVDATSLLPEIRTTFRYAGSLTTPPCSEGVKWNVMTTGVQVSDAQIKTFTRIIDGNDRPIQPLGARSLIEDTSPAH